MNRQGGGSQDQNFPLGGKIKNIGSQFTSGGGGWSFTEEMTKMSLKCIKGQLIRMYSIFHFNGGWVILLEVRMGGRMMYRMYLIRAPHEFSKTCLKYKVLCETYRIKWSDYDAIKNCIILR